MSRRRRRVSGMDSAVADFMPNMARDRLSLTQQMYIRVLTELSTNRFQWTGLPDSVDQRFLELELFRSARCVFYYDEEYGRFMALRGTPLGRLNMYNNSTRFRVISPVFSKELHATSYTMRGDRGEPIRNADGVVMMHTPDCVPIWANYLRVPDSDIVTLYASKLADIDRTIEINLMGTRHPFIIACDETEKLSLANAYRQVVEGQPVIMGTNTFGTTINEKISLLNLGLHPDHIINLQIAKSRIWNECMTLLGVNNANQDKKERLVSAEVGANDQQVESTRSIALQSRQIACDQINKIWPELHVSVDWNDQGDIADELVSDDALMDAQPAPEPSTGSAPSATR